MKLRLFLLCLLCLAAKATSAGACSQPDLSRSLLSLLLTDQHVHEEQSLMRRRNSVLLCNALLETEDLLAILGRDAERLVHALLLQIHLEGSRVWNVTEETHSRTVA